MKTTQDFTTLLATIREIVVSEDSSRDDKLHAICALLEREVAHYDWVGFYLVDPARERELVLVWPEQTSGLTEAATTLVGLAR